MIYQIQFSMKIKITVLLTVTLFFSLCTFAQRKKVLLIPLDDRPPCLQFTERMGLIGLTDVISPPRELLGKFTKPGDPDQIIEWLRKQDLSTFDAAIISLDMIAYGGLVASRVYNNDLRQALNRIKIINNIREKAPELPLYGQSVIMRLAPTSDGKNEAYREKLARWADISPYPENKSETKKLEGEIPEEALNSYINARQRNLSINREALKLTERGILDYLILSQDDAKPRGIHIADRNSLITEIEQQKLSDRVIIQPGTDEISMLLLARALNKAQKISPRVFVKYSSETSADKAMPFEDRPLRKTVGYNIIAAGASEVKEESDADLLFYVFVSRFDQGIAKSFGSDIQKQIVKGKKVIVADIDPKGDVQGGDSTFTEDLLKRRLFPDLYGYASWNTAGNTIGTTLPQGLIFHLANQKLMTNPMQNSKVLSAQKWFTLHRLLDDYVFHTIVRPKANEYFRQNNRSGFERPEEVARQVEKYSKELLQPIFKTLSTIYIEKKSEILPANLNCIPENMTFSLPWNRTFEAEIGFEMICR